MTRLCPLSTARAGILFLLGQATVLMCSARAAPLSSPRQPLPFQSEQRGFPWPNRDPLTLHPSRVVVPMHRWQIGWHQSSVGRGSSGLHTIFFSQVFVLRVNFLVQSDFQGGERFPELLCVT